MKFVLFILIHFKSFYTCCQLLSCYLTNRCLRYCTDFNIKTNFLKKSVNFDVNFVVC